MGLAGAKFTAGRSGWVSVAVLKTEGCLGNGVQIDPPAAKISALVGCKLEQAKEMQSLRTVILQVKVWLTRLVS